MLSAFFPDECRLCESPLIEASRIPVCAFCWDSIEPDTQFIQCLTCGRGFDSAAPLIGGRCGQCSMDAPAFDRAESYALYSGGVRKLVHLLKYDGIEPLAKSLALRLWRSLDRHIEADALIPAPMFWARRWSSRFNQKDLLARRLAELSGIRYGGGILQRTRSTPSQAGLSRTDRKKNLRGSFRVRKPDRVAGQRIALVDDIMTMGTTLSECARSLKAAGAQSVLALTVSRAELEGGRT